MTRNHNRPAACAAAGFALGAALVHLAHRARRRRVLGGKPPESMVSIDEAQGLDQLAQLVAVLGQMDPAWTRYTVDRMKDPGLLAIFLHASLAAIVTSDEMVRRVRTMADEALTAKMWAMPPAGRPDR